MKRRTLLQSIPAVLLAGPFARLRAAAQQAPGLSAENVTALSAMAEAVLPASIGEAGRAAAVERFVNWMRDYREGADRGHSYGASTLAAPTGRNPSARYPAQFAALDAAASAKGGASFAALDVDDRRAIVESLLNEPQRVTVMPPRPNGNNLIADFMGYYFASESAYDLAYEAAIGRDTCRGLEGSGNKPASLVRQ